MLLIRTLLALFALAAGAQASLAAEAWRVVASTGAVTVGAPGVTPIAVNSRQALPGDSWVETGTSGRVVLTRGQESIAVGPNSRVMLPVQPVDGNTQILQTVGTALYQIGKQKAPHFQVDTPYLAAVVKGTTFTVSVTEGVASVDVSEGLVQVATPDGADRADVAPGFTGFVTHTARDKVVVVPTAASPGANEPGSKAGKSELKESSNGGQRVLITAPIGEVSLDVKTASGGLVTSTEPAANTTKTKSGVGGVLSSVTDTVRDAAGSETSSGSTLSVTADGGGASVGVDAGVASAGVAVDSGVGASVDLGGGVVGADVGAGSGGVSADVGVGGSTGAGVSVDVGGGDGVGIGVGVGGGAGVSIGVGNGGVGLGIGLGTGGSGGGLGLGLGLGQSGS